MAAWRRRARTCREPLTVGADVVDGTVDEDATEHHRLAAAAAAAAHDDAGVRRMATACRRLVASIK